MCSYVPGNFMIGMKSGGQYKTNFALLQHIRSPITDPCFRTGVSNKLKTKSMLVIISGLLRITYIKLDVIGTI